MGIFGRIVAPLVLLCAQFAAAGCAYRFTNAHVRRPEGIQTIAVEAVYDTSREVIPHEQLWEALQNAFAADGHLKLAPQSSADALVRAHIKEAVVGPTGSPTANGVIKDPANVLQSAVEPDAPDRFRKLNQAGEYRTLANLTAQVEIEVWSLRTRTLLLKRAYPMTANFNAVRPAVTGLDNEFLRYQEAADATFDKLSQGVAQQVVKDLLVP